MKKIDRNKFDKLLINDKEAAIELLKDENGVFLDRVKLVSGSDHWTYTINLSSFFDSKAGQYQIMVNDLEAHEKIGFSSFTGWYFLGKLHFQGAHFIQQVNFVNTVFADDVYFNNVTFDKKTSFWAASFARNANFLLAHFKELLDFSTCSIHKNLDFNGAVFAGKCVISFKQIGGYVNFARASARAEMIIRLEELCTDNRLSYPEKMILIDKTSKDRYRSTKENLHSLKQILGKNAYYEEEDHIYYWYKVFSRKDRPIKWYSFLLRFLEILCLDKASGYFTKPGRVIASMLAVLVVSFFIYLSASMIAPETFGTLVDSVGLPIHNQQCFTSAIVNKELIRDFFYFDLITFTTIGYGDIHPTEWLRLYAGLEGLAGVLLMSLLIVTAAKKVLW